MSKYLKVMFGTKSGASDFEYKLDEVNIANNWNPNELDPKKMGGFNFSVENKIIRWLVRGDTLYDVTIPKDAVVVDCPNLSAPHGVFRSNKIILSNPRPVTDDMAMELYFKSELPEKSYFKAMAGCAVRGYINTAIKIFEDKINKNNIDIAISEFKDFVKHDDAKEFCEKYLGENTRIIYNRLLNFRKKKWNNYHIKTNNMPPRANIVNFIKNHSDLTGNAIDLGCGAGNDSIFLLSNGWNVLAIDGNDVESILRENLNEEDNKKLSFKIQKFEELELPNCNLLISNFAIPFCSKDKFSQMWHKICNSINKDGYFVGNLFGKNDEWNTPNDKRTFLDKEDVIALFKDFEIIEFAEKEFNKQLVLGKLKHWHIFEIVAKKK